MSNNRYPTGWLIILAGAVLLLGKLGVFAFLLHWLWPLLPFALGIWLHYLCMERKLPSRVLIAADTLVIYAFIFFICNLFGWDLLKYVWPGFLLGLAVGIYVYDRYTRSRVQDAFLAAVLLALFAFLLFAVILLMAAGVYMFVFLLLLVGLLTIWIRKEIV